MEFAFPSRFATLRIFNACCLNDYFDRITLLDGNNPRGIDVGVMIRKGFNADPENLRSPADDRKTTRLDYIFVDKSLEPAVQGADFFRQGLLCRCKQCPGPRPPRLTNDVEKASNRCPTTVVLDL